MSETLDLFKLTEVLLMHITADHITANLPKMWRHIFYPKMVDAVLEMHALIYYANTDVENRADHLQKYLGSLKKVEALTRVAHERRMLTHKQADSFFRIYESLNKQAAAWRKKAKVIA